jgi:aromatic-L-amino-acid/L-tryptophan decarboxylase
MKDLCYTPDEIRSAVHLLGEVAATYEADLADRSVLPQIDRKVITSIIEEPFPAIGRPFEDLIQEFANLIIPNSTQITHPRFLAYVLPSPNGVSPFADFLASMLNQNCNLWHLSPEANAIEQKVISWFLELFEMPGDGAGIITSGGSMANLTALTVARDVHHEGNPRLDGLQTIKRPLVLYASEEVHNSIDKAVALLGLGLGQLRHIPCDEGFRIRIDLLKEAVALDRKNGFHPFCVVGSAGTVTTGSIDPLDELTDFCAQENLWLHVDGAYGAFAIFSDSRLIQEGRAFLSRARVKDRFALRACLVNLRTTQADVDLIVEEVLRLARSERKTSSQLVAGLH